MGRYEQQRGFLKSNFLEFKHVKTDKIKGLPQPATVKPYSSPSVVIDLPEWNEDIVKKQSGDLFGD